MVDLTDDCIVWQGRTTWTKDGSPGYGEIGWHTRIHRLTWEECFGEIPKGLHVLHKCDNKPCRNPNHLYLGTHTDNMRDYALRGPSRPAQPYCNKGHEMSESNTYVTTQKGGRFVLRGCRKCRYNNQQKFLARRANDDSSKT